MKQRTHTALRIGALVLAVATFSAACGAGGGTSSNSASGAGPNATYTIGGVYPLSGESAAVGLAATRGAELAAKEVAATGGVKLKFSFEDSQLNTQVALTATQKLSGQGVHIILSGGSSVLLAQAPVATRDKLLLVNTMAQSPNLTGASDWLFNILPTSDAELAQVADIAINQLHLKTIGILVVDNALGKGDREVLTQDVKKLGGTVNVTESFKVGATDMRTALTRIRSANPDGLYIVGNTDEIGYAIAQTKELGLHAQLLGRTQNIDPGVLKAAGDAANGMVGAATVFRPSADNKAAQQFIDGYRAEYKTEPTVYAAIAHDSVLLIAAALKSVGNATDSTALRQYFTTIKDFPGAMGPITIGPDNTATYPLFRYRVVAGKVTQFS